MLVFAMLLAGAGTATADVASAAVVTSSLDEFKRAVDEGAADPQEVARLAVLVLVVYERDVDLARQMLSLLLEPDELREDGESPTGWVVNRSARDDLDRLSGTPQIARGYCGATPAGGYEDGDVDNCPVKLDFAYSSTRQGVGYPSEDRARFFVVNGGASRPRPIDLILIDGRWKVRNWGGLLTGVEAPAEVE